MTGIEKVVSKPLSDQEQRYTMKQDEFYFLLDNYRGKPFDLAVLAFRYGFDKGKRFEKARQKKSQRIEYTITPAGLEYLEGAGQA